jgi:hypothetical protein
MAKSRTAAPAAKHPEAPTTEWARWSVQLPPALLWQLKVRAAQERRPIRDTLAAAIAAYLATPAPGAVR